MQTSIVYDYLDVPAKYYVMDIWNRACLFSTVFGLMRSRSLCE
jgi:hypothetical protein